jgi:signal transduction histidine kinase
MSLPIDRASGDLRTLEAGEDAVLAVEQNWTITYLNGAARRLLDWPGSGHAGTSFWKAIPEPLRTSIGPTCRAAMAERQRLRVRVLDRLGHRLDVQAFPTDTGLAIRLRDLGHERPLQPLHEDELVDLSLIADQLRESAERAARERDEILGLISHDLKNPLHTIGVVLSVLQDLPHSDEERRARLAVIAQMVGTMQRVINGLLDMRRVEAGEPIPIVTAPVDPETLVMEACELFESQAEEKQIRLACHVEGECPEVLADRKRIQHVLLNLIGNAVKFTPTGGEITVVCRIAHGGRVHFAVADTGPGIPDESLPLLFDPHWEDKRAVRLGTGLALPIARGIIEAHGGNLEVDTDPGRGATFTFCLPSVPK